MKITIFYTQNRLKNDIQNFHLWLLEASVLRKLIFRWKNQMVKIILADGQTLNAHFLMKHLGLQEIISMFAIICQKMSEVSNYFSNQTVFDRHVYKLGCIIC